MTSVWMTRDAPTIADELGREGVKAVRLLYPDLHGVARGKDIPIDAFGDFAEHGVPFCAAVLATDLRHTPVVADDETYGDCSPARTSTRCGSCPGSRTSPGA